jgi:hypothetical protein
MKRNILTITISTALLTLSNMAQADSPPAAKVLIAPPIPTTSMLRKTLDECKAKYGEAVGVKGVHPPLKAYRFKVDTIDVYATLSPEGKVVEIAYSRDDGSSPFRAGEINAILEKNGTGWVSDTKNHWRNADTDAAGNIPDGYLDASYYDTDNHYYLMVTDMKPAIKAIDDARNKELGHL